MKSKVHAATAAQKLLNIYGHKLKVDGVWGPRSRSAYDTSTPLQKDAVNAVSKSFGYSIDELGSVTNWVDKQTLDGYVSEASKRTGLSKQLLWSFIELEAERRQRNGVTVYNARSVSPNGLYHGIMQMGEPAWSDVVRANSDIPAFKEGRYDPRWSVIAGAEYALLNQRSLRNRGYTGEFTSEVMYAAHNQGAAGFWKLLQDPRPTNNFNVQSAKAKGVIRTALSQSGVRMA